MTVLGRDGLDGFSAVTVAREAGISKATLFHYFTTMEEIPLVAFEQLWMPLMIRERSDLPIRDYLMALGLEVLELAREQRLFLNAYFVFFSQAIFKPKLRVALLKSTQVLHTTMLTILTEKLPATLTPNEIEATTCLIEMALDGMGLHLLVLREESELVQTWSRLIDLIAPVID